MRVLVIAMSAICVLCSSCSKKTDETSTTSPGPHPNIGAPGTQANISIVFTEDYHLRDEYQWYVCFGTHYENSVEKLQFVLFERGSRDWQSEKRVLSHTTEKNVHEGFLIDDSKKKIQLPTDTQLYQILDGKLLSSPERVTLGQLKAFLATEPIEYTLESLLEHTRSARPTQTE